MSVVRSSLLCALVLVTAVVACSEGKNSMAPRSQQEAVNIPMSNTTGSGTVSTPLGRATFSDPNDQNFNVKRITGDWQMQIKAKPAFDIAVQTIDFKKDAQSGWHSHPGPVFIQVTLGTMTFYESDDPTCSPIVRTAGQGYLDLGEHAHIARNESGLPAQTLVTYFVPPGAALKSDADRPGNCPF